MIRKAALVLMVSLWTAPLSMTQTNESRVVELSNRVADLEKQLTELRGELALLRQPAAASATPAAGMVASPPAASASAPSSVLGSTTVSGLVDVYYGYAFNQPQDRVAGLRSFDGPQKQFALNLVQLTVDKAPDPGNSRLGYHLAFGFGQAINAVNAADPGGVNFARNLKEAYGSYLAPVGRGLQIDVGKFVTPHGAEVIETKDNWNYSRGLLFSWAIPYYHFGLRTKYSFSDKYSVTGFLVNGWNNVVDTKGGKTVGIGFGWNPTSKLAIVQNYMVGSEISAGQTHTRQLSDTVITFSPTPKLTFVSNFDYGRGDRMAGVATPVFWTGIAQYVRYSIDQRHAVAARYEYYNDHNGFTTGTAQHLHGFTATFQRQIAHQFLTRLEFRRDVSNRPVFTEGNLPVSAQSTVTAGVLYSFDMRETTK